MKFHEVANIFPLMDEAEIADLAADIAAHGLREPIWLHPDGSVIDGRNRWLACERNGIVPDSHTWDETGTLVSFVLSLNLHRRHLTIGQRGLVAARIANLLPSHNVATSKEVAPVTQPDAAALLGVSPASVQRGRAVLNHGTPELIASVERGEVTIGAASKRALAMRGAAAPSLTAAVAPNGKPAKTKQQRDVRLARVRDMAASGHSSNQIAAEFGINAGGLRRRMRAIGIDVPADRVVGRSHLHDANRIVERMAMDAENLTADVNLIEFASLDRARIGDWIDGLGRSRKSLDSFIRRLIKEQKHG